MTEIQRREGRGLETIADEVRHEVAQAEQDWQSAVSHAIRAGELLIEAKAKVKHGEWLPWLEANFPGSARTAQGYMRLAHSAEDAQALAHLGIEGALKQLAAPKEPDRLAEKATSEELAPALSSFERYFHRNHIVGDDRRPEIEAACEAAGMIPFIEHIPLGTGDGIKNVWFGYCPGDWRAVQETIAMDEPSAGEQVGAQMGNPVTYHPGWLRLAHDATAGTGLSRGLVDAGFLDNVELPPLTDAGERHRRKVADLYRQAAEEIRAAIQEDPQLTYREIADYLEKPEEWVRDLVGEEQR